MAGVGLYPDVMTFPIVPIDEQASSGGQTLSAGQGQFHTRRCLFDLADPQNIGVAVL